MITLRRGDIPLQIIKWLSVLQISLLALLAHADKTAFNIDSNYAQTVWSAGHRDAANTDYVPVLMSLENQISKRLLKGHPIFWAPISGPEGNFYVTSGKGQGNSNLHAFDGMGNLLWKSKAQQTVDDLDGWAIINAPVVAKNGHIYVGDQNQLWAFRPNGDVKWVADLSQYGVDYGFMSAIISRQGYVGGISSNGKVIFFDADKGKLVMPVLDLPGGDGPKARDKPMEDLWKGLMDPELKPILFNLVQGWEMEVANTPAVHPDTGRVYITAYGVEPGSGLLYGIDVLDDHMEIAFQTPMGQGSGTSPAISQNGQRVYALDEFGHMMAIDAKTGEQLWKSTKKGGGAASPSVGPDETIYTLFQDHLIGFNYDGSLKFEYSYNQYCGEQIAEPDWFWGLFLSKPVAFLNSLFTVDANNKGWFNIVCGYHLKFIPSDSERTLVPIPHKSIVLAVDLDSGRPANEPLWIPETSEGFILPQQNGNQFVTLSGAISSIFYHRLNPLLPKRYEVPYEPQAGLLLLEPKSYTKLLRENIFWLTSRNKSALNYLQKVRPELAFQGIMSVRLPLQSCLSIIQRARETSELSSAQADLFTEAVEQMISTVEGFETQQGVDIEQLRETLGLLQSLRVQMN